MSNAAQSWAWQQEGLLSSDKLVLVALADNAWEDGSNAWPSVALLCRKTSLCRRTVQTALRRLAEAKLISEQAPAMPDQNKPTTYRLAMTPRAEAAPPGATTAQAPRATAAPALAQSVRKPRASDAPPPAQLTHDPCAAVAPEPSTNQVQEQPTTTAQAPSAQTLIAEWLDHCTGPVPSRVKGPVAKHLRELLDDGIPYETVRRGLAAWHEARKHHATLPSFVHEASQGPGVSQRMNRAEERTQHNLALVHQLRAEENQQREIS